jgi:hypothetical protein
MAPPPLTHHEIVELVEPFARRGRHLDLAVSDRSARRLVFKTREHPGVAGQGCLREQLALESFGGELFRVTRVLHLEAGVPASLEATGRGPAELLAQIESFEPQRQFTSGEGYVIARSYSLKTLPAGEPGLLQAVLTLGVVRVEGLALHMTVPGVRGVSAALALTPTGAAGLELPEDLLAVIGWNWARLVRSADGWTSRMRLWGGAARRSRAAEFALERAAVHLARTFAEVPARFHERCVAARWGVVFRRAIPALTAAAVLIAALTLPRLVGQQDSRVWILFFHVPTALIALSFCLQELPRFEIPPRPRRSPALTWVAASEVAPLQAAARSPGGQTFGR